LIPRVSPGFDGKISEVCRDTPDWTICQENAFKIAENPTAKSSELVSNTAENVALWVPDWMTFVLLRRRHIVN